MKYIKQLLGTKISTRISLFVIVGTICSSIIVTMGINFLSDPAEAANQPTFDNTVIPIAVGTTGSVVITKNSLRNVSNYFNAKYGELIIIHDKYPWYKKISTQAFYVECLTNKDALHFVYLLGDNKQVVTDHINTPELLPMMLIADRIIVEVCGYKITETVTMQEVITRSNDYASVNIMRY